MAEATPESVFLTGFPGFLGSELVARLLDRYPEDVPIRCLVQPKYREAAQRRADDLNSRYRNSSTRGGADSSAPPRVELYEGDITESDRGHGGDYDDLQRDAAEVYHLAAVYDLGVSREVGMAVNVGGTRNVLDFAEGCPDLRRFQYVSTCYVSGRHDGTFTHRDLDVGQSFNNHYEETKFLAEVAVQRRMDEGLPATIYRPAITVGDSRTGRTQKYDGPYNVLRLLRRQASLPGPSVVPTYGDPNDFEVNVVPQDFVVDAIATLSGMETSAAEVYQICDPNPPTVAEMTRSFAAALGQRVVRVPVPGGPGPTRWTLENAPGLASALGVEPAVVDYFAHPTSYTASNATRALRGTGVACPPFGSYVDRLVAFFHEHPDVSADPMA
ncbi:SDR family oxidoreductase [Halorussus litoreus]|uniref:SDR family oxidoreductase n=1 Tax=Halorussus litoreus TaxID=1710536 RepID=UPI000E2352E3|nr:SDR family oxidoreductase [Halorussus litoreus]